jgi:hypothetical protein
VYSFYPPAIIVSVAKHRFAAVPILFLLLQLLQFSLKFPLKMAAIYCGGDVFLTAAAATILTPTPRSPPHCDGEGMGEGWLMFNSKGAVTDTTLSCPYSSIAQNGGVMWSFWTTFWTILPPIHEMD